MAKNMHKKEDSSNEGWKELPPVKSLIPAPIDSEGTCGRCFFFAQCAAIRSFEGVSSAARSTSEAAMPLNFEEAARHLSEAARRYGLRWMWALAAEEKAMISSKKAFNARKRARVTYHRGRLSDHCRVPPSEDDAELKEDAGPDGEFSLIQLLTSGHTSHATIWGKPSHHQEVEGFALSNLRLEEMYTLPEGCRRSTSAATKGFDTGETWAKWTFGSLCSKPMPQLQSGSWRSGPG